MSNEKLDVDGVAAKFGVPPERIVDYLALIGDSVDNIPGVDKVGPKTAAKWIAEHGSLEGVIAAAPTIKGVVGENLRKALDWLPQGRRLVTVVDRLRPDAATSSAGPSSTRWRCATIDVAGAARVLRPLRLRRDASASSRRPPARAGGAVAPARAGAPPAVDVPTRCRPRRSSSTTRP